MDGAAVYKSAVVYIIHAQALHNCKSSVIFVLRKNLNYTLFPSICIQSARLKLIF